MSRLPSGLSQFRPCLRRRPSMAGWRRIGCRGIYETQAAYWGPIHISICSSSEALLPRACIVESRGRAGHGGREIAGAPCNLYQRSCKYMQRSSRAWFSTFDSSVLALNFPCFLKITVCNASMLGLPRNPYQTK